MSQTLLIVGAVLLALALIQQLRRAPWQRRLQSLQPESAASAQPLFRADHGWQGWLQQRGVWPSETLWPRCRQLLVWLHGGLFLALLLVSAVHGYSLWVWMAWPLLALLLSALLLWWQQTQWLAQCQQQLPQALEQLARATAAGLGLQQALAQICEQLPPPLQAQFAWIQERMRIGDPIDQVMEQAAQRLPMPAFRFFCLAVVLNQETGGRLSQVLDSQSKQLKAQQHAQQKLRTLTSEPRMAANVVALIPVLMFVALFWLSPRHVEFLLHDSTGQSLLGYAVVSVIAGLISIRWLLMRAAG